MSLPTTILPAHHRHCDDLFVAAEEALRRGDWSAADSAYARFEREMQAHLEAEEAVLFPAFEDATGMAGGPTQMMRYEHEQMRALLEQMRDACARRDAGAYGGAAETLLTLIQQHNMKEENILYPMCDRALGPQAEGVAAEVGAVLAAAQDD